MLWFTHFKKQIAQNTLLVAKVVSLKQTSYSYLYLETHQQEKATHTNDNAEKEVARKGLITSCCNCCYL